jgi:hypothetical protein
VRWLDEALSEGVADPVPTLEAGVRLQESVGPVRSRWALE